MKTSKAEAAARIQFGFASKSDFEKLSLEDIQAIKTDQDVTHYRFVERGAKADATDEDNRTVIHVASSEHTDSVGDRIMVAGWDTSRLKLGKIPLLPGHDPQPIPLGLVLSAKKSKGEDGVKVLETKSKFHEQELYADSEWGKHVEAMRTLVLRGDMPGVSVGFMPKAYHWPSEEERDALAMPPFGMIFDEQELLELSVTPIPANSRAQERKSLAQLREGLRELVATGKLTKEAAEELAHDLVSGEDAWLQRAARIGRTVVPLSKELPWIKCTGTVEVSAEAPSKTTPEVSAETTSAIDKAVKEHVDTIARDLRVALRRDLFAGIREILEPIETAITEAADELEDAATRLGLESKDSERAEVSRVSAPNGASATSAASTGTSRDNPTTLTESRAGSTLISVLCPAFAGTDENDAAADRRNEAQGMQDRQ